MNTVALRRHPITLSPQCERLILRPFLPSDATHIAPIVSRVRALSEDETERAMDAVLEEFSSRHLNLQSTLLANYDRMRVHLATDVQLSRSRRLLIGALFSGEYSLESAALFNPSMVMHPDQSGAPDGAMRFILSLRSVGEGHISSIEFRSGMIDAEGEISIDTPSGFVCTAEIQPNARYKRKKVVYAIDFPSSLSLDERVIFPVSANESNGIEDARFVRFIESDGSTRYYATYTAYNGHTIRPQLIETRDFLHFQVLTLGGTAVKNKGMALFPRRVGGRYAMLSRQDDENILIMFSDDPHNWSHAQVILRPAAQWESVKIGNCGSPIETEAGWLVITHGVGPMRKYCLGAALLDLEDPTKVVGRLDDPLVCAQGAEREGYVPNVVYSCGSLLHGRNLILPFAMSDRATTIATVSLDDLLGALTATAL
jgi:predicted GH43/DUF377 family glycosyl hydrolase